MPAMSNIDSNVLNSLNSTTGAAGGAAKAAELQESFMTLLVAQLKHQDPMNPMENAEMTSQIAQINTVSGIAELNTTLAGINDQIDASQTLQAASLIGKGVLVPGDRVLAGAEGSTTPIGIELASPADAVTVTIYGGSGEVVRRFEPFPMSAGVETLTWDGTMGDGTLAPEGAYRVGVEATAEGDRVDSTVLNYAMVSGISTGDDGPLLDLGGISGQVALDEIRKIL
jgi:flagellar basal-body rod modification protein FlgD